MPSEPATSGPAATEPAPFVNVPSAVIDPVQSEDNLALLAANGTIATSTPPPGTSLPDVLQAPAMASSLATLKEK